jgi:choline kinase
MIGVILAAGKGSRLGSITMNKPKSLLEIKKGTTLLDYNINRLRELNVEKIIIVTGFCSSQIEDHVTEMKDIEIHFNPFWDQCNVLGSLYTVLDIINDNFYFLHADTIVEKSVWLSLSTYSGDIVLPYKRKKCGEEEMKLTINQNTVCEINKTMDPSLAIGEFLGIAKFKKNAINIIKKYSIELFKTGRLDFYVESAIQMCINNGISVEAMDIGESVFVEVDFSNDYEEMKKIFS